MTYGDGGSGKTTLAVTSRSTSPPASTGSASRWHARPASARIENEGPRPLFRSKLRRKLDAWRGRPSMTGSSSGSSPWATFTSPRENPGGARRRAAEHEFDVVIVGPLNAHRHGGRRQEVRDFAALLDDVRHAPGARSRS